MSAIAAASTTGAPAVAPRARRGIDPRYLQAGLATAILLGGQFFFGTIGGFERLALALGSAVATEWLLSWWLRGKPNNPVSAYISGVSVALLVKPGAALWPFVIGAVLSIASKYAITFRGRHLFNPTNFGLCVLVLLAPDEMALLSTQWGSSLAALAFFWCWGFFVVYRARVLHVTVTYLLSFVAFAALRGAIAGNGFLAELAPATGTMQTLFMFFMVTDPATVVSRPRGRILVTILVATVECAIRLMNNAPIRGLEGLLWAPSMFALFFVMPVAKWIDLRWFAGATPSPRVAPR